MRPRPVAFPLRLVSAALNFMYVIFVSINNTSVDVLWV